MRIAVSLVASVAIITPAEAIFWNNNPDHGVTSEDGLSDRVDWFENTHAIRNLSNSTQGTTTLLNPEWALTVRHVVQNGGNFSQIAAPDNIYVDVFGRRYYADEIFTPDGDSEIALVHLRGGEGSALDATGSINASFNELGRVVQVGGYGYRGHYDAGGNMGIGAFRRAYNVGVNSGGQIRIVADGEAVLSANGLLEGTVGSGDSGGPTFAYYGPGIYTSDATLDDWRLIGLAAIGTGNASGESWGGFSNYTRVASHASWIHDTLNSQPDVGPAATQPWQLDSGDGLYDTGGDKFSVTGPGEVPAAHAAFGPNGKGFTLDSIGDSLAVTAILDTTLELDHSQLRYGIFDDAGGTIAGDTPGGTTWNGYFVGNAVEGLAHGVLEKGPGAGVGQWWSDSEDNSASIVSGTPPAGGTYDDPAGQQSTPAGRYALQFRYTRQADGLRIDYSTEQIDDSDAATGVYLHEGSVLDTSPVSPTWTYNQLGFVLSDDSYVGTIIVDDILVTFDDVAKLPGDFNGDGTVSAADYLVWRNSQNQQGPNLPADGNDDLVVNQADYELWRAHFGDTLTAPASGAGSVPEPGATVIALISTVLLATLLWRPKGTSKG